MVAIAYWHTKAGWEYICLNGKNWEFTRPCILPSEKYVSLCFWLGAEGDA